jgi:hypothetical protein
MRGFGKSGTMVKTNRFRLKKNNAGWKLPSRRGNEKPD